MVNLLGRPWWRGFAIALLLISLGLNSCQQLSPEPRSSQNNHILEFVPKQALLAAVVDTTVKPSKTWQDSHLTKTLSQTIDSFFTPLAINPSEDIRPWLGPNIAFAITDLDLDRNRHNGRQTGYLLITDTTDEERLREFLELFWQRQTIAGTHPVLTEGSGVPIISGALAQGTQQLATAVIGGTTLLVANDVRVLRQSLRVAQAPALQLSGQDCCTPAWINLHIPDLIDWLGLATPTERQLLSSLQGQQLRATASLRPQQLIINTRLTTLGNRGSGPDTAPPDPTALQDIDHSSPQQYLPASIAWAAMGHDLRPLWTELKAQLAHYQGLPFPLQQGQQWPSTQLAQSLSGPLHQLLARDYAVGQLSDGTWLMAVTSPNPTVIEQLDRVATQQGLTVSQLTLEGQSVKAWSRLKTRVDSRNRETTVETDLVGVHTKVDDCEVFATSIGGLTMALAAPAKPLSTTQRFQHTTQSMDKPNQGYIYGTWSELDRLLENNRWFSLVKPILQPWSQSIDAISITSYAQTVHQSTGTVSVLVKN